MRHLLCMLIFLFAPRASEAADVSEELLQLIRGCETVAGNMPDTINYRGAFEEGYCRAYLSAAITTHRVYQENAGQVVMCIPDEDFGIDSAARNLVEYARDNPGKIEGGYLAYHMVTEALLEAYPCDNENDVREERCDDYQSVMGTFGDTLPEQSYDLSVTKMDEEMLKVVVDLHPEFGEMSLESAFLRLEGENDLPTVIPIFLGKMSGNQAGAEYWILNADYDRSGIMSRYEIWRNESDRRCLSKKMTYIVPMPARSSL